MWRHDARTAALGVGPLAAVGAGYGVGRSLWGVDCSLVACLACLAGAGLALVAAVRKPRRADSSAVEPIAGCSLLAYIFLANVTGQFAFVQGTGDVAVAAAWLSPLVAGGVALPRRGGWLAGLACWAVLFAGTAALTYSATHTGSGVGLLFMWLS